MMEPLNLMPSDDDADGCLWPLWLATVWKPKQP